MFREGTAVFSFKRQRYVHVQEEPQPKRTRVEEHEDDGKSLQ
jgi:hypothetical protein